MLCNDGNKSLYGRKHIELFENRPLTRIFRNMWDEVTGDRRMSLHKENLQNLFLSPNDKMKKPRLLW
jgi:hypothetical protein